MAAVVAPRVQDEAVVVAGAVAPAFGAQEVPNRGILGKERGLIPAVGKEGTWQQRSVMSRHTGEQMEASAVAGGVWGLTLGGGCRQTRGPWLRGSRT